ncbi:MAG: PadR family transcriptional regulator [Anaerolineaceae bacterium]
MSPRKALPLHLEYALLGLIRKQPLYGYEILQNWDKNLGIIWHVKPGTFYAALNKLDQQGFLSSTLVSGEAYPARKVFAITPEGEQAFLEWMQTPVATPREFRQEFFARLYFFQDVSPDIVENLLHDQTDTCLGWREQQRRPVSSTSEFERQVRSFRVRQIESILDYLTELSKTYLEK